jgi:hypothetical protein
MRKVISFDRDGTVFFGGGPVTKEMLLKLKAEGIIIGPAGGALGHELQQQWLAHGVEPDFWLSKPELGKLKEFYPEAVITHVGDTEDDKYWARRAGIEFMDVEEFVKTKLKT